MTCGEMCAWSLLTLDVTGSRLVQAGSAKVSNPDWFRNQNFGLFHGLDLECFSLGLKLIPDFEPQATVSSISISTRWSCLVSA